MHHYCSFLNGLLLCLRGYCDIHHCLRVPPGVNIEATPALIGLAASPAPSTAVPLMPLLPALPLLPSAVSALVSVGPCWQG